ncbi:hypothetical protein OPKNFCMD_6842 [Methylobacterium crusticola]|uniref:Lysozyme inhibitor LprI-like N-terminal domain-containing protein n=1 Tax=Methylobacterium crusticola TaxID=1697972 RepID=A0ABQ4R8L2_9HYPH|nr:lysozyme inhibitor LprI family protein [Methylobacterium crusticola]GJD54061.1 hypothetical protein OPKNFCMD_6842 [Methylobacterium crusticola]
MLRPAFLSAVLLAPVTSAWAGSCADAPNQMEATSCASEQFATADAELNRLYGVLRTKLDVPGQRNLVAAQRAWITFRDLECNLRTGYDPGDPAAGGTIASMLVGECRTELTRQRSRDLQAQIRCPGGDLSCTP